MVDFLASMAASERVAELGGREALRLRAEALEPFEVRVWSWKWSGNGLPPFSISMHQVEVGCGVVDTPQIIKIK